MDRNLKHYFLILLAVLFGAQCLHAETHVPGELLVKLAMAPRSLVQAQVSVAGVNRIDSLLQFDRVEATLAFPEFQETLPELNRALLLRFPDDVDIEAEMQRLEGQVGVEWVSFNHIYRASYTPNDSDFATQWYLPVIEAQAAWDITRGDTSVIIGIIDTGIDYTHPDLILNLWRNTAEISGNGIDDDDNGFIDDTIGWDFVDAPSFPTGGDDLVRDADPMDEMGHGTFVAGVASATTDNEVGIASIGFRCRLMSLRAGNSQGWLEEDDVAAALLYAMNNGAGVVNMSFGDVAASPLLSETVRLVHDAGVVLVASAGNSHSSMIHYPSGYSEVICVGASNQNDQRASFSNYGPWVDVFAPGTDILSTELGGTVGTWSGLNQGTSYTAPMVAGLVGLLLSANPLLTPEQVLNLLRQTADDLYPAGWDSSTTHGRINARRAVENAGFTSGVVARIISPQSDEGFSAPFEVIGTAAGPALNSWKLLWGVGENPLEWVTVSESDERMIERVLGEVVVPDEDVVIAVRLEVEAVDGTMSVDHIHLFIDHSPPNILEMNVQKMLDAAHFGELVQIKTDDITSATLILTNAAGDSVRKDFGYVSNSHTVFLSQNDFPGVWNYRALCTNRAGQTVWSEEKTFFVSDPPFASNFWTDEATSLLQGHLLATPTDFDNDGRPEVFMNQFDNGAYDDLRIFEWTGSDFSDVGNSYGLMIPQGVGDYDSDGLLEFLGRAYNITYIFEQEAAGHFPDSLEWRDTTGYYAYDLLDIDTLDGQTELLAWRNFDGEERYALYRMDAGPEAFLLDTFPNPSEGYNQLGPPYVLVGDLDSDGLTDFLYGDYDGDVIFCEYQSNGQITAPWYIRLPYEDATNWMAAGDADGDGEIEFIAGCRFDGEGGTESQVRARHWEYFIFHRAANDSFVPVDTILVLGAESPRDHDVAVAAGDVDGDGRDEFLIAAFPDLYIIDCEPFSGRYVPAGYFSPCENNAILICDWNDNGLDEFFFGDGNVWRRAEAAGGAGMRPLPPVGLEGQPLGPNEISLTWRSVAGADSYRVWQGETSSELSVFLQTTDTMVFIPSLPEDVEYVYAVTTIDHDYPEQESAFSSFVTVIANQAPTVEHQASFVAPHFVRVNFSEAMGTSIRQQHSYILDDGRMPRVITTAEGERVAFVEFEEGFSPRLYRMELHALRDAQNSPLPEGSGWVEFTVEEEPLVGPYIASLEILSPTSLTLNFSESMNNSVLDTSNYRMSPMGRIISIQSLEADLSRLQLGLDERWPVGAVGRSVSLHVTGVTSAEGVALDSANGIAYIEAVASNLDGIYVYPNPYKGVGANGTNCVMFAGLTSDASVYIFALHGRLVKKLEGVNSAGGLPWCLSDEDGNAVASGIYLYTVMDNKQTRRGKFAVMR